MRRGSPLIVLFLTLACAVPAHAAPDPLRNLQWGMTMIHADEAHATTTGAGATVAVIDTGALLSHPDLQGRLVAGRDFVQNDDTPQDGEGHGTHVAGIVAANADNGIGVEGVAPGAKVLVIRVLGDDGSGSTDDVAAGIDYAVDHGADVINLSLGSDTPLVGGDETFDTAIDRALDRGLLVVVAAAGNSALPSCDQPSSGGRLLCVAAVDRNGNKAFYSNFGGSLGISAPGGSAVGSEADDILSTYSTSRSDLGLYNYVAGTSQATPHVAGVAALLVSLGVRGQAAVQRILATARDAGFPGPDAIYGAGIVDAQAAVAGLGKGGGGAGGGGAGGTGGGSPGGSAVKISLARVQKIRTVLLRGIKVRCTAAGAGRCSVRATAARRLLAAGSQAVKAGKATSVAARLNRHGRSVLLADLRRRHPRTVRVTLKITLPGARTQTRAVLLQPLRGLTP